jgi:hypothetical protein
MPFGPRNKTVCVVLALIGCLWILTLLLSRNGDETLLPAPSLERTQVDSDPEDSGGIERRVALREPSRIRVRVASRHDGETIVGGLVALGDGSGKTVPCEAYQPGILLVPRDLPGDEVLHVTADGFFPSFLGQEQWKEITSLEATSNEPFVTLFLAAEGKLLVTVRDEEGNPLEGVFIRVEPWDEDRQIRKERPPGWNIYVPHGYSMPGVPAELIVQAGSDANGQLLVGNLPCDAQLRAIASLSVLEVGATCAIDPVQRYSTIELTAQLGAALVGKVVWDDGVPAADVTVRTYPSQKIAGRLRRTDRNGMYRFGSLPLGTYMVNAPLYDSANVTVSVMPPAATAETLVLSRPSVVSGMVNARLCDFGPEPPVAWGRGLLGWVAVVCHQEGSSARSVQLLRDGRFSVGTKPGKATLTVRSLTAWSGPPLGVFEVVSPSSENIIDLRDLMSCVRFEIPDTSGSDPEVRFFPYLDHEGTRRSEPGRLACYYPSPAHLRRAIRGKDDAYFVLGPPAGDYDVRVDTHQKGSAWIRQVSVPRSGTLDLGRLLTGFGSLSGRVTGEFPQEGDLHVLAKSPGSQSRIVPVEDRTFEFKHLPAGPWIVCPVLAGSGGDDAEYFDLYPGDQGQQGTISLNAPGELRVALSRDGLPIVGGRVAFSADPNGALLSAVNREVTATTNTAGLCTFSISRDGRYTVSHYDTATGSGYFETVEVAAGASVTVHIGCTQEGRSQLLFLRDGEPLTDVEYVIVATPSLESRYSVHRSRTGDIQARLSQGPTVFFVATAKQEAGNRGGNLRVPFFIVRATVGKPMKPTTVALARGTVRIACAQGGSLDYPRVFCEAIDGVSCEFDVLPIELATEPGPEGSLLVPCLPPGTGLRLEGWSRDGSRIVKSVEYSGPGPMEIDWP